jgi:4-hydroxy-3-polyprenylbenzoate decarboxylase
MSASATRPIVAAITGASGAPYAVRLVEQLVAAERRVMLVVSAHGLRLLRTETPLGDVAGLREHVGAERFDRWVTVYDDKDRGAAPASGSSLTAGMVVCPCSMGTLSAIAQGSSRSLVERAADVTLKERRPLVLVPRETPLSLIHLENMTQVTRAGATVMPAAPGFYHRPQRIEELVDFMVQRVLDHLGVEHRVGRRWSDAEARDTNAGGGSGAPAKGGAW